MKKNLLIDFIQFMNELGINEAKQLEILKALEDCPYQKLMTFSNITDELRIAGNNDFSNLIFNNVEKVIEIRPSTILGLIKAEYITHEVKKLTKYFETIFSVDIAKVHAMASIVTNNSLLDELVKRELAIRTMQELDVNKIDAMLEILITKNLIQDETGKYELAIKTLLNAKVISRELLDLLKNISLIEDETGKWDKAIKAILEVDESKREFMFKVLNDGSLIRSKIDKYDQAINAILNVQLSKTEVMCSVVTNLELKLDETGKYIYAINAILNVDESRLDEMKDMLTKKDFIKLPKFMYIRKINEIMYYSEQIDLDSVSLEQFSKTVQKVLKDERI